MKRHSMPGPGGLGADDAPKRERGARPPVVHNNVPARRRHPAIEPEPIRIPPAWMPADRRARRHRFARATGKAAVLVAAFALLSLPFILNHLENGKFYWQKQAPVVVPELTPPAAIEPATPAVPVTPDAPAADPVDAAVLPDLAAPPTIAPSPAPEAAMNVNADPPIVQSEPAP